MTIKQAKFLAHCVLAGLIYPTIPRDSKRIQNTVERSKELMEAIAKDSL